MEDKNLQSFASHCVALFPVLENAQNKNKYSLTAEIQAYSIMSQWTEKETEFCHKQICLANVTAKCFVKVIDFGEGKQLIIHDYANDSTHLLTGTITLIKFYLLLP